MKGLASYTVPKIDVQVSAAFQSLPGARWPRTTTSPPRWSRSRSAATCRATCSSRPSTSSRRGRCYGDRVNQIDLRVGKIAAGSGYRTQFSVDLYNALNSSAIQTYNQTFIIPAPAVASVAGADAILPARFAKITAQFDF